MKYRLIPSEDLLLLSRRICICDSMITALFEEAERGQLDPAKFFFAAQMLLNKDILESFEKAATVEYRGNRRTHDR